MRLCTEFAESERDELSRRGITRARSIGELEDVPTRTRRAMERSSTTPRGGESMTLTLALYYGGRHDIVDAMRAARRPRPRRPGVARGDRRELAPRAT